MGDYENQKQGVHTERHKNVGTNSGKSIIDDQRQIKKIDSFFGQVSNQEEEYLMEYVVGNNASSGSQDENDEGSEGSSFREYEEESISPLELKRASSRKLQNNNNNNSPYKQLKHNLVQQPSDLQKMSVNSFAPSSKVIIE